MESDTSKTVLMQEDPVRPRLSLLDRLELHCRGVQVSLPEASQRLLAILAMRNRHMHRSCVAGALWIDTSQRRAAANLRTALWRIRKLERALVVCDGSYLRIGPDVQIDLAEVTSAAQRLIAAPNSCEEPCITAEMLSKELLPEWNDDWIVLERERLRQLRLHGLEALCRRLAMLGRYAAAIEAGLVAVTTEPLRETTQHALIAAHLGEGNISEAIRQYDNYRKLLYENLGVEPGRELRLVMAPYRR